MIALALVLVLLINIVMALWVRIKAREVERQDWLRREIVVLMEGRTILRMTLQNFYDLREFSAGSDEKNIVVNFDNPWATPRRNLEQLERTESETE